MLILLALLWLCLGAIIGFIVQAANLQPVSWRAGGRWRSAALGAALAFASGWLGILLLGRSFATALALWVTVVGVVGIPWLLSTIKGSTTPA